MGWGRGVAQCPACFLNTHPTPSYFFDFFLIVGGRLACISGAFMAAAAAAAGQHRAAAISACAALLTVRRSGDTRRLRCAWSRGKTRWAACFRCTTLAAVLHLAACRCNWAACGCVLCHHLLPWLRPRPPPNSCQHEHMLVCTQRAQPRLSPQTVFLRNYTTEAAKSIPDNSLDFVYVDARWVLSFLAVRGRQSARAGVPPGPRRWLA